MFRAENVVGYYDRENNLKPSQISASHEAGGAPVRGIGTTTTPSQPSPLCGGGSLTSPVAP
jgi:hypothetical protein